MSSLQSLPLEILRYICDYLAPDDRQSIFDFSLASRQCYHATNHHRLERVYVTVVSRKRLEQDIEQWSNLLQRTGCFAYVHDLHFEGTLPPPSADDGSFTPKEEGPAYDEDEMTCPRSRYGHLYGSRYLLEEEERDVWGPVAQLVARLPGLRDLTWACTNQFPPCLLQVLHQDLPRCRLHMKVFRLRSLCYDVDHPRDIDEYEYSLASSPSLSSIVVPISRFDSEGHVEYNFEAAMQIVSGLAPNLKDAQIVGLLLQGSAAVYRAAQRGRRPWQGFFIDRFSEDEPVQQSHIPNLGLDMVTGMHHWGWWLQRIAIADLHTLRLQYTSLGVLENLRSVDLVSLKVFVLDLEPARSDDETDWQDTITKDLLQSLRPLEKLHITCDRICAAFDPIMTVHGRTLRTLSVMPRWPQIQKYTISPQRIREIAKHCPAIQDLRLRIPRTQGNAAEVQVYRALRDFSHVRDLTLELDCCMGHQPSSVSTDIFGRPTSLNLDHTDVGSDPEERDRAFLINLALDESLARQIFDQVTEPEGPLCRLNVEVASTSSYLDSSFQWYKVRRAMQRRWNCVRFPGGSVRVREVGIRRRKQVNQDPTYDIGDLEPAIRRVWPVKTGDWKKDWHSFPLSLEESAPRH
ncbi:uncharacterized protein N7459_005276 [Penicillium hispanicum]|uniref:uncharacterized protein n=1 Tax=Penicillium hispanicum TaxID=1080232 RepID=UPI00254189B9|nr:uncharacterized protein N7459_005276 [Penicillium hispanicum]KAJ5585476.1 hypothetical protein N7459_005276 [Penicillium hispanicum]